MPGNLEIAVLYEPSDNTTPPTDSSGRVRHKERRRTRTRRRWHGPERRQKIDREHVAEALRANGYEVSMYELSDESALLGLAKSKVDLILNMVEAYAGDDSLEAHVAAFLDLLELRYTGADPQALFLAQDKALAKKVFDFHGIRTPRFASVYRGKLDHVDDLEFPLIVKPASEDGSVGIDAGAVVRNLRELMERASMIQERFDCAALIEEFIEGREIYVGIIGNDKPVALPVVEMDLSKLPDDMPKIAGTEVKWEKGSAAYEATRSAAAKGLGEDVMRRLQDTALQVYSALKLRDYGRVDVIVRTSGEPVVLEVNTLPGMTETSLLPKAAAAAGIRFPELCQRMVDLAMRRQARVTSHH